MATTNKKTLDVNEQMESLRRLTDPTYSGPGTWGCIHTKAAQVKDYNDLVNVIKFIEFTIENLKCAKCKAHAQEYLKNHPIRASLDCKHQGHSGGLQRCLFNWTCDFHNAVNIRLSKPIIQSDVAWNFYSEPEFEVCTAECDHSAPPKTITTPIAPVYKKEDTYEAKPATSSTTVYYAKSVPFRLLSR
mgnify:CR=1 FL=1